MNIKNWLKMKIRRALNLPEIEEYVRQIRLDTLTLRTSIHNLRSSNNLISNHDEPIVETMRAFLMELIDFSRAGSIFTCQINGMNLLAPVELLRLYPHCLHPQATQKLTYWVESQQSDWLCSHLQPGDVALDVGAAFGIISLALSKVVGEKGSVHAFEPSRTAQNCLQKLLEINHAHNVTLVKSAIADAPGFTEFIEYTSDNDLSWASDTSTLASPNINPTMNHLCYAVDVTTIDEYVAAKNIKPKAIKIDIEGFELYALHGGKTTLEKFLPYLCIDIHKDVKTGESALLGVEPFLSALGYQIKMEGHALYCMPK
ncbi:FkbM family methyltransferase [Anabaena sp. UHCC 0399]|uniref:FkbM family methyltransferase n=1 Tax=Anabaena sp. UHCC 0399 TaxID=3110238 RepID=UPI002B1FEDF6|nr:FkbM family methyltransferase [Anabaena sp. UHCC 0399]MEA5567845.1 FkbM family methyltransferase [Anabaena sp. UHCC 0399]